MRGKVIGILAATLLTTSLFTLPAVAAFYPDEAGHDNSTTYNLMLERTLGDPFELIAGTVRDDAATYPRPTALDVFLHEPFGTAGIRAASLVEALLQKPEYSDIHLFKTSNGAVYLYSDRLMSADWAVALAEWIEVGSKLPSNQ